MERRNFVLILRKPAQGGNRIQKMSTSVIYSLLNYNNFFSLSAAAAKSFLFSLAQQIVEHETIKSN
jgi:hypothetical protein